MKFSKEIKVGLLLIFSLVVLIIGFNFLKGKNLFVKEDRYFAVYEKIDGLKTSDIIVLNGFRIGRVENIDLMGDGSSRILVSFLVRPNLQIPRRTVAKITSTDLLGTKSITLEFSDSPNFYTPGDTLIADIQGDLADEVRREILPVKNRAEELLGSIDSLFITAKSILDDGQIVGALQQFENAIGNLAKTAGRIDTLVEDESNNIAIILDNIKSISTNLEQQNHELARFIQNMADISDSLSTSNLKQLIANAEATFEEINRTLVKMNEGDGSIAMLLNDPELYENLNNASENLDLLIKDLKDNPQRYVRFSIFGRP